MTSVLCLALMLFSTGAGAQENVEAATVPISSTATFAGGNFWYLQPVLEAVSGVTAVTGGYTGGSEISPTYEEVASGNTGHLQAVQVRFDTATVDFSQLLDVFWKNIDPTQADGQFRDRSPAFRTAIFYHDQRQKRLAEESKDKLAQSGRFDQPIATEIRPAREFYPAEKVQQDFCRKNVVRCQLQRRRSGRDKVLKRIWR